MQSPSQHRHTVRISALFALLASPSLAFAAAPQELADPLEPQRPPILDPSPPSSELASAPAALQAAVHAAPDELLFDEPGDGAVWARGTSYKARFDGSGATIVPFFGSDAPRNFPLALQVSDVTFAGAPLDGQVRGAATRAGHLVSIDHGAFVEEYALALDSLEQRFVFPSLRGSGDLVLRIGVDTELAASDLGTSLRFSNDLGHVDYGEAFALDADGQRLALDSRLVDGAIELVVPADFVAGAALPLVIDPFVTAYTVSGGARAEIYPDVSYDVTTDRWCFVWTDVWSANDHDVFARLATGSYQLLNTLTIDFTSETWTTPKIANNNGADVFLIAAAVVPSWSPYWSIHGRFVLPGAATTGAPFQISPADSTDRYWPDIGGDPYPGSASYFCVVWQRVVSATNADIESRIVTTSGSTGAVVPIENGVGWHEHPYIANSTGLDVGDGAVGWTVTWQHRYNSSDHDIWGAQLRWTGSILHPMFAIQASTWDETEPMAATMLDPITPGGPRTYLVVYARDYGSDHDVFAAVMQGPTVLATVNLVGGFDPSTFYYDQLIPTADSDGSHFLVGFVERNTPTSYDTNIWMCDYYWSGSALVPCEVRKNFAGSPAAETDIALHSMASSAGPRKRYAGAWVFESINNGYDIVGGLWDGCAGGQVTAFCAGDGSGASCPCGNNGANGRGCANSANSAGARLTWVGETSTTADTFKLLGSGMPSTATCLFFQTFSAGPGTPFGDGLRCATGNTLRIGLKTSNNGAAAYPSVNDVPIHLVGQIPAAGATAYYQAWYRDPASFCTSTTYNLTNALRAVWIP